jgi:DDE_Tnp_1-associated
MEPSKLRSLVEHVALFPEPGMGRTSRHLLLNIVVIAVCPVICGADSWLEPYGHAKYAWLKHLQPLPRRIRSDRTFAQVLPRLAPEAFRTCFLVWLTEVQEWIRGPLASQVVAIDGKAARHSFDCPRAGGATSHDGDQ